MNIEESFDFLTNEVDKLFKEERTKTLTEVCIFLRSFDYADAAEVVECAYGLRRNST